MEVIIYYYTSWNPCYMRARRDDKTEWEDFMFNMCEGYSNWMKLEIIISKSLEFVVCNENKTLWDNPPESYSSQNYTLCVNIDKNINNNQNNMYVPYVYTLVNGHLQHINPIKYPPIMLVCDLDNTLIGHNKYLYTFNTHWKSFHLWRGSILVYNTGRSLRSFLEAAYFNELLKPDYVICGVGTEIYTFSNEEISDVNLLPYSYRSLFKKFNNIHTNSLQQINNVNIDDLKNWILPKWCPSLLYIQMDKEWESVMLYASQMRQKIKQIIDTNEEFDEVNINGNEFYDPFRVSLSTPNNIKIIKNIYIKFSQTNYLLISGGDEWRYIDLLPKEGGKLNPTLHLIKLLQFANSRVLLCGDSGNDIDFYYQTHLACCIVKNAYIGLLYLLKEFPNYYIKQTHTHKIINKMDILNEIYTFWKLQSIQINIFKQLPIFDTHIMQNRKIFFSEKECAGAILEALFYFSFSESVLEI